MSYQIKELFLTLQGEGYHAGRSAVFCRFTGCNLWTGREVDRDKAICNFCDTDFRGTDGQNGGTYSAKELAIVAQSLWRGGDSKFMVLTGGEPMLQVHTELIQTLKESGFYIAIETNGTIPVVSEIDWVCVSPKKGSRLLQKRGNELKLVFPQSDFEPFQFSHLDFDHFYLQPMDGPAIEENTKKCIEYCLQYPQWKLSVQTHKYLGID